MANGDEGFTGDNPAGFIRSAITEGENQSSAYGLFRDFGGSMQESQFNKLYGNVWDTMSREPETLGLDPFNIPGPGDYGEWATRQPGLYATQVEMQVFDRDLDAFLTMPATYVTDEPHTPAEAEQWAIDQFDPENTGADYNQIMMGAVSIHLWRTTPLAG